MIKKLPASLFFLLALFFFASCSQTRYGHLSYVKSKKQLPQVTHINKKLPQGLIAKKGVVLVEKPEPEVVIAEVPQEKAIAMPLIVHKDMVPKPGAESEKKLTDSPQANHASALHQQQQGEGAGNSALRTIGWILIILGIIFLLLVNIILGLLLMLGGLLFVVAG